VKVMVERQGVPKSNWTIDAIHSSYPMQTQHLTNNAPAIAYDDLAKSMKNWQVARAATAGLPYFSEFKLPLPHTKYSLRFVEMPLEDTESFATSATDDIKDLFRRGSAVFSEDSVGTIVSIGTTKNRVQSQAKSLSDRTRAPIINESFSFLNLPHESRVGNSWRFDDGVDIGIQHDEWKPSGSSKDIGKATMKRMEVAFTNWSGRTENIVNLEQCARELVAKRRARTRRHLQWRTYATGVENLELQGLIEVG